MKILKPSWVHHDSHPIFCIDIHPDDTRFATGGQGADSVGRIVIWNMKPVLAAWKENEISGEKENCVVTDNGDTTTPKLLCQLDHHNACVNAVRWSHSGRFLASGGDDRIIIIWRLTGKTNPSVVRSSTSSIFGKTAYETWKPLSTLRSHGGDILDLSWSPGDKYLASASVDNTVLIWDAHKFPTVIAELKGHTSLVKGVTWDPVGKFVATQSDDKTLKIWRTSDWKEDHVVEDPFHECGGTTHVLRLDWSPDGMYLVSAHAMNGGGPTAQIIERDGWKTDKDFVGHRKAVVCVRFNSNILTQKEKAKACCVALGSRDRSISVWSTHLRRPLLVVQDLFTNSVMDLTWSSCGTIMMACSWDGTVAVHQFTTAEIGTPLTLEEKSSLKEKYYGKSENNNSAAAPASKIIQNVEVFLASQAQKDGNGEVEPQTTNANVKRSPGDRTSEFDLMDPSTSDAPAVPIVRGPTDKQIETRTPDGKRRITPKFIPNLDPSLLTSSVASTSVAPSNANSTTTIFQNPEQHNSNHCTNFRENMVLGIDDINIKMGEKEAEKTDSEVKGQVDSTCADAEVPATAPSEGKGQEQSCSIKSEPRSGGDGNSRSATVDTKVKENAMEVSDPAPAAVTPPLEEVKVSRVENQSQGQGSSKANAPAPTGGSTPPTRPMSKFEALVNGYEPPLAIKIIPVPPNAPTTPAPSSAIGKRKPSTETQKPSKKIQKTAGDTPISVLPYNTPRPRDGLAPTATPSTGISPLPVPLPTIPKSPQPQTPPTRRKLNPMKINELATVQVSKKPDVRYTLEAHNQAVGTKRSYALRCHHHPTPTIPGGNPLFWVIQTEAPICGVTGDGHRIVAVCEDATVHVLDLKGRYAFPPLVVPAVPAKMTHNGPFLLIVTTKGTLHLWNIHTKKSVMKAESIMGLINQPGNSNIDIAFVNVSSVGIPRIVLTNGKSFQFNSDLGSWMSMSDPSITPGHAPDQSLQFDPLAKRTGIISQIKLRLATATELERSNDVREWLIVLGKSLAVQGLRAELRQLCQDLLGPTHSSAGVATGAGLSTWSPTIVGVNKRDVLQVILRNLLKDLAWQDFYCEFQDLMDGEGVEMLDVEMDEEDEGQSSRNSNSLSRSRAGPSGVLAGVLTPTVTPPREPDADPEPEPILPQVLIAPEILADSNPEPEPMPKVEDVDVSNSNSLAAANGEDMSNSNPPNGEISTESNPPPSAVVETTDVENVNINRDDESQSQSQQPVSMDIS